MELELSNLSLFAHAIARALLLTGLGPGLFIFYVAQLLVKANRVPALHPRMRGEFRKTSSGAAQLAPTIEFDSSGLSSRATSAARKVRRSA
jgi:hypothetical protein